MDPTVGQLAILTVREILKRILNKPQPTISETEIANVVRQNVIGKATTIIVASGSASAEDKNAIMLVTQRCIDLMSQMNDLEVTLSVTADGTRSVTVRKTKNIAMDELIRSVEDTEKRAGQLTSSRANLERTREQHRQREIEGERESNADILARIRERVNRPEEEY
jgi:hypothetical protein